MQLIQRLHSPLIAVALASWLMWGRASSADMPAGPALPVAANPVGATYVGRQVCAGCHAKEAEAWRGSHHDLAMQGPSEATVLGDFGGARFSHRGVVSRFFKRGDTFYVHTEGPDGKLKAMVDELSRGR